MNANPAKSKLAAGGTAFGSMVFEFFTPGMPRLLKNAGAEYALYCMEHTGASFETMKTQFALCRALGVVPLARVSGTEYDFIEKVVRPLYEYDTARDVLRTMSVKSAADGKIAFSLAIDMSHTMCSTWPPPMA